jgi:Protein of unknown function (DUF2783)
MTKLNTQPNFAAAGRRPRHAYGPGDDFYDALIAAHRGLSDAQSELLNARLLLLLANHVGDLDVLREAIALARGGVAGNGTDPQAGPSPRLLVK